jgi:signal transduction histidine kinase
VTAAYLAQLNAGTEVSKASSVLISSGASIQALVDDLVDFNRTNIGLGINIMPTQIDLSEVFTDKLKQLRGAYAQHRLELEVSGEVRGYWDGRRVQQLLGNLAENAIKYGAEDMPVRVVLSGRESEVLFEVRNSGPAIEPTTLDQIFDPLVRGRGRTGRHNDGGLGLGLYIAREIAKAHGGNIEARSDPTETVFAVRLPRVQPGQRLAPRPTDFSA